MNIFVLDKDPKLAATQLCDKHVPKMVLETAQLLCSPFKAGDAPYRQTHVNHPCSIWTRGSVNNFEWLLEHGIGLGQEYKLRFGKDHASSSIIWWCVQNYGKLGLEAKGLTPFALAMPDEYKVSGDAVRSYRNYYLGSKVRFAKWDKGRSAPNWWTPGVDKW